MKTMPVNESNRFAICLAAAAFCTTAIGHDAIAGDAIGTLVQKYCVRCHGGEEVEAAIDLRGNYRQIDLLKKSKVWNRVLQQLEMEAMPPDEPYPSAAEYASLIAQIKSAVHDVDWQKFHSPGRIGLARLTTVEYQNAVRDIFEIDLQAGAFLSKDPEGNTGFTNDRESLTFPLFAFDNFLREAERVVDAYLSFSHEPWSQTIDLVAAWKAGSDGSVALTDDGESVLIKDRNAPYQLNLDLPFAGMYRIGFHARTVSGEPISAVNIAVNGKSASRRVITGDQPDTYWMIQNLPSGANVLSFGYDPDRAPIIQDEYEPRTVPDSIANAVKKPPVGKLPLPDSLRGDIEAVRAWKNLNRTIREFVVTQRLADRLVESGKLDYERHDLAGEKPPATFSPTKVPFNLTAGKVAVYLKMPQAKLEKRIQQEIGFSHNEYRKSVNRYKSAWREKYPERAPRIAGSIALDRVIIESHACGPADKDPGAPLRDAAQSVDGTRRFLRRLGTRAYGREIEAAELDRLMRIYRATRQETGLHNDAVRDALVGLLVSPPFLLRYYMTSGQPEQLVASHDFAERISRLLWLSLPDEPLRLRAKRGELTDPEVVKASIDRMIDSPKFDSMAKVFVEQWLDLESLSEYEYSRKIKAHKVLAMRQEPVLFFADVFRNNRSLLDFVDADFTYLNASLAHHYGVGGIDGQEMRRVRLVDDRRGGLMAMAGILTTTSTPNRTSPVRRGAFIVELLLGEELPPPPPNVPELKTDNKTRTVREELELHRQASQCAGCHKRIDPFGFVLEHYDQFGQWRDRDRGKLVSAATELVDGTKVDGLVEFKAYVSMRRREDFVRNLTQRLFEFALGRKAIYSDEATIRAIMTQVKENGYKAKTLLYEIVMCEAFQKQESSGRGNESH